MILLAVAAAAVLLIFEETGTSPENGSRAVGDPRRQLSGFRFETAPLTEGPLATRAVSFRAGGERATGLLTMPAGRTSMPAVVYLHGLGADSRDFATEARFMAAKRVVTLAVDSADVLAQDTPLSGLQGLRADLQLRSMTTRRALAAIDALSEDPRVEPSRIALVGFSRGGAVAAQIAEKSPSLAAELYISAGAGLSTWPGRIGNLDRREGSAVSRLVSRIDPVRSLRASRSPRPRMVQLGTRDDTIPLGELRRFAEAV